MKRIKLLRRRESAADREAREVAFYTQLLIFAVALIVLVVLAAMLPESKPEALPMGGVGR